MIVDSHCHLADEAFQSDLAEVVERARAAGLARALCILSADEPEEIARAAAVRQAWPDVLFATAIHPHRTGAYAGKVPAAVSEVTQAIETVTAVAVGEIGLDYHYDFSPRAVQAEVFAAQIEVAVNRNLPVVIHTREATDDTLAIIKNAGQGRLRGVMHCFSGSVEEASRAIALGFWISLAGIVTFPKAEALRDVARAVPLDRLLIETDAPFLAPVPFRGKRNEPAFVARTLEMVASLRRMDVNGLATQLAMNFDALLGIKTPVN